MTTTTACPVCGAAFAPVRRQRYCGQACRQAAYRRRQPSAPIPAIPVAGHRCRVTVYACTNCEQRYLGEQWCPDCQRPCIRIGEGGLCPHCDEPVAVQDLLDQHTATEPGQYAQTRPTTGAGSQ